jgi:hypothetical protein
MAKKTATQTTQAPRARKTPPAVASTAPPLAESPSEDGLPELATGDRRFLGRVGRFLVYVHTPNMILRAQRAGYTTAEHTEGWRLYHLAGGGNVPLDGLLANVRSDIATRIATGGSTRVIEELDRFENTWFPRTRAIIRRVVPAAEREAFTAAFFRNLDQQPIGPAVVASVSTYIDRVRDLEESQDPSAPMVRAVLEQRGLNAAAVENIQSLLAEVQMGPEPTTVTSDADIPELRAQQLQALGALRDWYNDWGTTLRSVFGRRDLIRLGLSQVRSSAAEDEDDDDEAPEVESEDDERKAEPPPKA